MHLFFFNFNLSLKISKVHKFHLLLLIIRLISVAVLVKIGHVLVLLAASRVVRCRRVELTELFAKSSHYFLRQEVLVAKR